MKIIGPLIQFRNQLQLFHWQADTYAQHKAFGRAYKGLEEPIDTFVEVYIGIFGHQVSTSQFDFNIKSFSNENISIVIEDFLDFLTEITKTFYKHTDLLNIKDTILAQVNQLKYLLTLK